MQFIPVSPSNVNAVISPKTKIHTTDSATNHDSSRRLLPIPVALHLVQQSVKCAMGILRAPPKSCCNNGWWNMMSNWTCKRKLKATEEHKLLLVAGLFHRLHARQASTTTRTMLHARAWTPKARNVDCNCPNATMLQGNAQPLQHLLYHTGVWVAHCLHNLRGAHNSQTFPRRIFGLLASFFESLAGFNPNTSRTRVTLRSRTATGGRGPSKPSPSAPLRWSRGTSLSSFPASFARDGLPNIGLHNAKGPLTSSLPRATGLAPWDPWGRRGQKGQDVR